MSDLVSVFHFDEDKPSFENLGKPNGLRHWAEADVRDALGYKTAESFRKVILRAMQACLTLGIATDDAFIREGSEYKLTRFACYLVAMNGDSKKPQVAAAQLYFATLTAEKGLRVGDVLLDYMGKAELAANLFRVTQTEARIKSQNLQGQKQLDSAAHEIGRKVRDMMIENTAMAPEHLPIAISVSPNARSAPRMATGRPES